MLEHFDAISFREIARIILESKLSVEIECGNIPLKKRTKYFKSHQGEGAIVKNVVIVVY
jgi:competence CoiA-like predicted nuclease